MSDNECQHNDIDEDGWCNDCEVTLFKHAKQVRYRIYNGLNELNNYPYRVDCDDKELKIVNEKDPSDCWEILVIKSK